jgi:hypothetical protein
MMDRLLEPQVIKHLLIFTRILRLFTGNYILRQLYLEDSNVFFDNVSTTFAVFN